MPDFPAALKDGVSASGFRLAAAARTDETGMRPDRGATCDDRPGARVLAGCSVVHPQAYYSNYLIDKRPPEPFCHHRMPPDDGRVSRGPAAS